MIRTRAAGPLQLRIGGDTRTLQVAGAHEGWLLQRLFTEARIERLEAELDAATTPGGRELTLKELGRLTQAYGLPNAYSPRFDPDWDQIPDASDLCPAVPENYGDAEQTDGCPEPSASDEDQVRFDPIYFSPGAREPKLPPPGLSSALSSDLEIVAQLDDLQQLAIEGNARGMPSTRQNLELSAARARWVEKELIRAGVPPEKIAVVVGLGDVCRHIWPSNDNAVTLWVTRRAHQYTRVTTCSMATPDSPHLYVERAGAASTGVATSAATPWSSPNLGSSDGPFSQIDAQLEAGGARSRQTSCASVSR